MRAPLAPPRLSLSRKVDAEAQAVETSWVTDSPGREDRVLERRHVLRVDQLVVHSGDRVLPDQLLVGDLRAEVPRHGPHVAVGELEPRPGERVGELVGMFQEAPGDRLVDRVEPQRQVRRQHHRGVTPRRVVRIGHGVIRRAIRGTPLMRPGRAAGQFPLVAEENLEEAVVPPRRRRGPDDLQPTGDRVVANAGAERVAPAEALLLDRRPLGLTSDVLVGVGGAVGLAEGVATGDQCDGLLVVHGHAGEGLADVAGRGDRVGVRRWGPRGSRR